jgi:hypothetical protein
VPNQITGADLAKRLGVTICVHPQEAACIDTALRWAAKFGDLGGIAPPRKITRWAFASFAAAAYPNVDAANVSLAADFTNWIGAVDDLVEAHPERIPIITAAHMGQRDEQVEPVSSLVAAWRDVESRLCEAMPDSFRDRVKQGLGRLFWSHAWEAQLWSQGKVPSLPEYKNHRHENGGLPIYLLILERAIGGISHDVSSSTWFIELNQRVGNLACFANDLLQHEQDRANGNPMNLVRVIEATAGAARAFDHSVEVTLQELNAWRELSSAAPTQGPIQSYVAQQPYLISGTFRWMDMTHRYASS